MAVLYVFRSLLPAFIAYNTKMCERIMSHVASSLIDRLAYNMTKNIAYSNESSLE